MKDTKSREPQSNPIKQLFVAALARLRPKPIDFDQSPSLDPVKETAVLSKKLLDQTNPYRVASLARRLDFISRDFQR